VGILPADGARRDARRLASPVARAFTPQAILCDNYTVGGHDDSCATANLQPAVR